MIEELEGADLRVDGEGRDQKRERDKEVGRRPFFSFVRWL